jgi:hypothetical protein
MFHNILADVNSVFASSALTSNNIAMYPENYQGSISNSNEFCRFNILPSASDHLAYGGDKSLSGLLIVRIFVKAGEGQTRIMQLSDILDNSFENKILTNKTEFGKSYLNVEGLDPANQSLYSAQYIIPFKIYGE